jgi:hypothetical protein
MLKKTVLITSCFIALTSSILEGKYMANSSPEGIQDRSEVLLQTTRRYLDFINQLGRGEDFPQLETAASLLSTNCKKVLNGQLFTNSREEFVSDLLSLYDKQGGWKVSPADIIVASPSNTVVLRLFIEMNNSGTYTTIVILRYDSSQHITEINEVLNEVKGDYGFKDIEK